MRVSERKFYTVSAIITLAGMSILLFSSTQSSILAATVIIALGYSNLFAIIFSLALKHLPQRANEISSLLIVGVSGGIIATLLGVVSDTFGTQWAAMAILALIWLYMIWLIKPVNSSSNEAPLYRLHPIQISSLNGRQVQNISIIPSTHANKRGKSTNQRSAALITSNSHAIHGDMHSCIAILFFTTQ
jgi:MFS family permease